MSATQTDTYEVKMNDGRTYEVSCTGSDLIDQLCEQIGWDDIDYVEPL